MATFEYHINLDERGEFCADVRSFDTGDTIYVINGFDIFEDGFMKDKRDMNGLFTHLTQIGFIATDAKLIYVG